MLKVKLDLGFVAAHSSNFFKINLIFFFFLKILEIFKVDNLRKFSNLIFNRHRSFSSNLRILEFQIVSERLFFFYNIG